MTINTLILEDDKLYTPKETADSLRLTERQISRLRQAGKLGCVRLTGSAVRHSGRQIREFIASRSVEAVS